VEAVLEHRGEVSIIHHVPGRIRVRVSRALAARARGNVDPQRLDRVIRAIGGVEDVRVNPAVGSVTIRYDKSTIEPDWWNTLLTGDREDAKRLTEKLVATVLAPAIEVAGQAFASNA
jgi:hypothetical protein